MESRRREELLPVRTHNCRTIFRPQFDLTPGSIHAIVITTLAGRNVKEGGDQSNLRTELLEAIEKISGIPKRSILYADTMTSRSDTALFGPLLLLRNRFIGADGGTKSLLLHSIERGGRFHRIEGSILVPDFCEKGCRISRRVADVELPLKKREATFQMFVPTAGHVRGFLQIQGFPKDGQETGIFFRFLEEFNIGGIFVNSEIVKPHIRDSDDVNAHIVSWLYGVAISKHLQETVVDRINDHLPGLLDPGLTITGFCIEQDFCPRGMALNPYIHNTVVVIRNPAPYRILYPEDPFDRPVFLIEAENLLFDLNSPYLGREKTRQRAIRIHTLFAPDDLKKIGELLNR
jgi:hypothetical protein